MGPERREEREGVIPKQDRKQHVQGSGNPDGHLLAPHGQTLRQTNQTHHPAQRPQQLWLFRGAGHLEWAAEEGRDGSGLAPEREQEQGGKLPLPTLAM